jgi:hypothetical protein
MPEVLPLLPAYDLLAPEPRLLLHAAAHLNPLRIQRDLLRGHVKEGLGWSDAQFDAHLNACFDLHLVEGDQELRLHQLFAAFLNGREDQSGLTGSLGAVVKAEASRLLAIARDVAAQPNRLDLASLLTIYPLQPERWLGGQGALSPADGEVIGRAFYQTGLFAAAQPWFERAVAEAEVHGRVDHASLGRSLNWVGSCLSSRGEFAAAQPWFERAVAEAEQGDVHGRVDQALVELFKETDESCSKHSTRCGIVRPFDPTLPPCSGVRSRRARRSAPTPRAIVRFRNPAFGRPDAALGRERSSDWAVGFTPWPLAGAPVLATTL